MAFIKRSWTNRQSEYPNRRRLTVVAGMNDVYDVSREEGLISDEGNQFNGQNMNELEGRVDNAINELISGTVKAGKAVVADSANAIAWGNVSGKPTSTPWNSISGKPYFVGTATYTANIGTAPSQNIAVGGILATDNPTVDVILSGDRATDLARLEAWETVSRIVTYNGGISVICYEQTPAVAIPIQLKVVR